jgi:hypothetical protein
VSALTVEALDAIDVEPLITRIYIRQCYIPTPPEEPDPLWIDASAPSRWRTPSGTLYVAEDLETAMAEYCRNSSALVDAADPTGGVGLNRNNFQFYAGDAIGDPLQQRAIFSTEVAFERVADLRSSEAREALRSLGIAERDLVADDYGPCPQLATLGEASGWQAVRAESAANNAGTAIAIFNGAFPTREFWRLVEPAMRPTVRIAYLTRYKSRERPAWLAS